MFKRVRHYGYKEDPFIFLKQDDEMWAPVRYALVFCILDFSEHEIPIKTQGLYYVIQKKRKNMS